MLIKTPVGILIELDARGAGLGHQNKPASIGFTQSAFKCVSPCRDLRGKTILSCAGGMLPPRTGDAMLAHRPFQRGSFKKCVVCAKADLEHLLLGILNASQ